MLTTLLFNIGILPSINSISLKEPEEQQKGSDRTKQTAGGAVSVTKAL
jgi:hypothetical protein